MFRRSEGWHRLDGSVRRFLEKGISILLGIRIRWSSHDFIPRIYSKQINASPGAQCKALWIFCITGIIFNTILFYILRFYSFQATVKLIVLNTKDDFAEDRLGGAVVSFTGWDYANKFPDLPETEEDVTTYALRRIIRLRDFASVNNASAEGIWIAYSSQGKSNSPTSKSSSSLSTILLRDFQFLYTHELGLALRFHLHGRSRIHIIFHSTHSSRPSHKIILYGNDRNDGITSHSFSTKDNTSAIFCPKIIYPPQEHGIRYDSIDIIAITPTKNSVVVIDQIVLALGNEKRSLHMLYTLFPKAWCGKNVEVQVDT